MSGPLEPKRLCLDIHGVGVALSGRGVERELDEPGRDFAYFEMEKTGPDPICFSLVRTRPEPLARGRLRLRDYAAFDDGCRRRIDYDDEARAVYDFARKRRCTRSAARWPVAVTARTLRSPLA